MKPLPHAHTFLEAVSPPEAFPPAAQIFIGLSELWSIAASIYARHRFDRVLIAQCLGEGWAIVTSDAVFRKYQIKVIW